MLKITLKIQPLILYNRSILGLRKLVCQYNSSLKFKTRGDRIQSKQKLSIHRLTSECDFQRRHMFRMMWFIIHKQKSQLVKETSQEVGSSRQFRPFMEVLVEQQEKEIDHINKVVITKKTDNKRSMWRQRQTLIKLNQTKHASRKLLLEQSRILQARNWVVQEVQIKRCHNIGNHSSLTSCIKDQGRHCHRRIIFKIMPFTIQARQIWNRIRILTEKILQSTLQKDAKVKSAHTLYNPFKVIEYLYRQAIWPIQGKH